MSLEWCQRIGPMSFVERCLKRRKAARYSDSSYSDSSKSVMQWVMVIGSGLVLVTGLWLRLGLELVSVAPFQKHFVGIAVVGIAACTLEND